MIRIQAAINPGGITLAVDGQLISEYVAEIEASIRESMEPYKAVDLFLRNVSDIDEAGQALLSRLAAQGVELRAAGLYSSHVITQVRLAPSSRQSRAKR